MEPISPTSPGCMFPLILMALFGALGIGFFVPVTMESAPVAAPPIMDAEVYSGAANADVTFVRAVQTGPETWTFHVTVAHPDTGWDDYADGWDVVLLDGSAITVNPGDPFTRLMTHPHETEQPFTRSQNGIVIPASVTEVRVRAHDLVDGWGGREVIVDLSVESGPDFAVERQ